MNAIDRRYKKEAAARAKEYVALMHGYAGSQEKKAFKIAEKLRYNYWLESLAALPADERRAAARLQAVQAARFPRRPVFAPRQDCARRADRAGWTCILNGRAHL